MRLIHSLLTDFPATSILEVSRESLTLVEPYNAKPIGQTLIKKELEEGKTEVNI